MMNENHFESFGEHIRNILSPYANLVAMLENYTKSSTSEKDKELLEKFLFNKKIIANLKENLEHFKEFSNIDELEKLNWRSTELFERYSNE